MFRHWERLSCSYQSIGLVEHANFIIFPQLWEIATLCATICHMHHSPARIAFPGWVSLAFPAAAAAAARHRGLTNVPVSCMATNLPASLLSERGPERGARALVRGWCLADAHGGSSRSV